MRDTGSVLPMMAALAFLLSCTGAKNSARLSKHDLFLNQIGKETLWYAPGLSMSYSRQKKGSVVLRAAYSQVAPSRKGVNIPSPFSEELPDTFVYAVDKGAEGFNKGAEHFGFELGNFVVERSWPYNLPDFINIVLTDKRGVTFEISYQIVPTGNYIQVHPVGSARTAPQCRLKRVGRIYHVPKSWHITDTAR